LQRIHAAFVAMLEAGRQIVRAPGQFGASVGGPIPEIATAYYREFLYSEVTEIVMFIKSDSLEQFVATV
jgi:hypothetical protein